MPNTRARRHFLSLFSTSTLLLPSLSSLLSHDLAPALLRSLKLAISFSFTDSKDREKRLKERKKIIKKKNTEELLLLSASDFLKNNFFVLLSEL
jgi:hypothetical protein